MSIGINKAGAIDINYIQIINAKGLVFDVTPQVESIEIYEDLFETFISGKILIKDCQALSTFFPMVGQEFVKFSMVTPTMEKNYTLEGEFYIYRMSDKVDVGDREALYTLSFISKEAIIDLNKKISKTFRGDVREMLAELVKGDIGLQSNKMLYVEYPNNSFAFCSNWWKPTKAIQYICEHAKNSNNSSSYLFFETMQGFGFESLDALISDEVPIIQYFTKDNYSRQMTQSNFTSYRDLEKDYQSILEINYKTGYDFIERIKSGYYGGEIIDFNVSTQQYSHRVNNLSFDEGKHLNKFSPIADNTPVTSRAFLKFIPKATNIFENYEDVSNAEFAVKRKTVMSRLNTNKVLIRVHGRTDYSIGQKMSLNIPKNAQLTSSDSDRDEFVSGVYLVTSLTHSIAHGMHYCILELVKDSYVFDINESGL